jgi:hypothetical protein
MASLAGGVLTVQVAADWTAVAARYPEAVIGLGQLKAQLAEEEARADALQGQLDQIVAGTAELAGALDEAGTRLGSDAATAAAVRASLATARARLAVLQRAIGAAGAAVPRRGATPSGPPPPATPGVSDGDASAAATPTPSAGPLLTYPPGVPADWPSSRPIPPQPSGCVQPQLELDGTWNCQH